MQAPKVLEVEVTQKHIDEANKRLNPSDPYAPWYSRSRNCPIALAIKDKYGDEPEAAGMMRVSFDDGTALYRSSADAFQFMAAFDSGNLVGPASFTFPLDRFFPGEPDAPVSS